MKAIIIAGGLGTRLGKYTKEIPKCMLNFLGKPLIERQINVLNSHGIKEVVALTGHFSEKINAKGITRSHRDPPGVKNMVNALLASESELKNVEGDVIVSYGDIIFDEETLKKVIECDKDICVAVDCNWKEYWTARFDGNIEDVESLQIGKEGDIIELGTLDCSPKDCHARYVGLIKFSKRGLEILRKIYHENKEKYWDKDSKWLNSKSFKQAYMTDMLQAIINSGFKIWPVRLKGGWLEFDTEKDYELAIKWAKEGILNKFIKGF